MKHQQTFMGAWVRKPRLHRRADYVLWVVKCASHQTSLAVSSVVAGRVATVGAASSRQLVDFAMVQKNIALRSIAPRRNSCGAIVRFFRYLVSEYYSDFCANLRDLVGKLRLCEANNTHPERAVKWQGLEAVYGAGFFHQSCWDALIAVWIRGPIALIRIRPRARQQHHESRRSALGWSGRRRGYSTFYGSAYWLWMSTLHCRGCSHFTRTWNACCCSCF